MQITKCNKCEEILKQGDIWGSKWANGNFYYGKENFRIRFDLCEKCSGKLAKYIKNYLKIEKK